MIAANIHASCIVLGRAGLPFGAAEDTGILLLGESGAGKSDIALRLIGRGALLVADDRVELFLRDDRLWACAPGALAGLIEARGLGIVKIPFAQAARVDLVVRLVPPEEIRRLPERAAYEAPHPLVLAEGVRPALIALAPECASAPDRIVLAAAAFANALFREESNPL